MINRISLKAEFTKLIFVGLLLFWCANSALLAQPPQKISREGFQPKSADVFEVVLQFYELDDSQPLDVKEVDIWEEAGAVHQKLVFTTQGGERVPGDLVIPSGSDGPFPAVLLLHGLGGDRGRWWEADRMRLPKDLLPQGIAVFTIDLELHGERSVHNDYQNPVRLTLEDSQHTRSRDMVIQSTLDARRALALLTARTDIDSERMAVVGYSMGGMISSLLAVLEPNLAAVVIDALPMREHPLATDPFNFAPRIEVPTLLQIGREDWMSSPDDAHTFIELLKTDDHELLLYNAGHHLPKEFAADAARWVGARMVPD